MNIVTFYRYTVRYIFFLVLVSSDVFYYLIKLDNQL